jgi:hypothetical protein
MAHTCRTRWHQSATCAFASLRMRPGKGPGGKRYAWKENDPLLAKLAEAAKEYKNKTDEKG